MTSDLLSRFREINHDFLLERVLREVAELPQGASVSSDMDSKTSSGWRLRLKSHQHTEATGEDEITCREGGRETLRKVGRRQKEERSSHCSSQGDLINNHLWDFLKMFT